MRSNRNGSGRLMGSLSGSMNMIGNLGGAVGPLVDRYFLSSTKVTPDEPATLQGWTTAFLVAAVIYGIDALARLFIDPVTPLEKDSPAGGS